MFANRRTKNGKGGNKKARPAEEIVASTATPIAIDLPVEAPPIVVVPTPAPLLGLAVPAVAPMPRWEQMRAKVVRAGERVRHKFHTANQLAARYGGPNLFLNEPVTTATGAHASTSESLRRSNIDDMMAATANEQTTVLSAGTGATLLDNRDSAMSISEFVNKRLGLDTLDTLGRELFQRPYRVAGLSMKVPNIKWQLLEAQRAELEVRRRQLERQQQLFVDSRTFVDVSEEAQQLQRELAEFVPIEDIELIKPESEVRALNAYWRHMLEEPLIGIYRQVEETTARSLRTAHGDNVDGADPEGITAMYLQRVAAPVFDQYLDQLRSANFEDMPLTREILEDYFYRYMTHLLEWLLRLKRQENEQARELLQRAVVKNAGNVQPSGIAKAAEQWRRVVDEDEESPPPFPDAGPIDGLSEDERERRIVIGYLREALYVYATPVYEEWFARWIALVTNDVGAEEIDEATVSAMQRAVRNLIKSRQRTREERRLNQERGMAPYEPMTQRSILQSYVRLINNDLALRRIKQLDQQEKDDTLGVEIANALTARIGGADADQASLSPEVLFYPRLDRLEILAKETARRRKQLEDTFRISLENADDGEMPDAQWRRDADALRGGAVTALADLDRRSRALRDQLIFYSPLTGRIPVHGPRDEIDNGGFSPYDLSYPLDVTESRRQRGEATSIVERLKRQFDADNLHHRLDRLRSVLSYDHAEQMIRRDLMRIEYVLRHLTTPEVDVAVEIERSLTASRPLELAASLQLRHELALLAQTPSDTLADEKVSRARSDLVSKEWTVTWFFKQRYGNESNTTVTLETQTLPIGTTTARFSRPSSLSDPLAVGGAYWCEFSDGTEVYRSEFTALVRVTTLCKRSGQRFELGTELHGQAAWDEWPRDEKTRDDSEEYLVLVTRGQTAYNELLRQRQSNERIRTSPVLPSESLFLPPWGREDEANLLRAFASVSKDDFRWSGIVGNIVARLGGQLRDELKAFARANPAAAPELKKFIDATDMKLFALIVDRRILSRVDGVNAPYVYADIVRAIHLHALQQASRGAWSDKTIGGADVLLEGMARSKLGDPLFSADIAYSPENLVAVLSNEALLSEARLELFLDKENVFDRDALAFSKIKPLEWTFDRGVDELPLASWLAALHTPVVWRNLTWREQRFLHRMHERFENFARNYRVQERQQLYYNQILRDQPWSMRAAVALGDGDKFDTDTKEIGSAPISDLAEQEIDRRLARFTAGAVKTNLSGRQYGIADNVNDRGFRGTAYYKSGQYARANDVGVELQRTFLLDSDLWNEFKDLIFQRLVRRGLLSVAEHGRIDNEDPQLSRLHLDRDTDPALMRLFSNRETRTNWEGSFSHTTDQPDSYIVSLDAPAQARIVQRGSAPVGKGYDFSGIHEYIESTAMRINEIDNGRGLGADLTAGARLKERAKLVQIFFDLALMYNYFAFVAAPFTAKRIFSADDLYEMLETQREQFFERISRAAGASGGTILN